MIGLVAAVLATVIGAAPAGECKYAHDVATGGRAPCTGVLIPLPVASECVRLRISLVPRLQLKLEQLSELRDIETKAAAGKLEACETECSSLRSILESVSAPPARPWHESPAFVATTAILAGVLAGIVGTLLAVDLR